MSTPPGINTAAPDVAGAGSNLTWHDLRDLDIEGRGFTGRQISDLVGAILE